MDWKIRPAPSVPKAFGEQLWLAFWQFGGVSSYGEETQPSLTVSPNTETTGAEADMGALGRRSGRRKKTAANSVRWKDPRREHRWGAGSAHHARPSALYAPLAAGHSGSQSRHARWLSKEAPKEYDANFVTCPVSPRGH
ncbi:hypothetical protein HPB47_003974 [Ixodes persulcatus]|uniref:Uncharacterized protein n=1 Tax=Ixodes persulcatus TaxID=34615 RepID=A0AC60PI03_IXOPE|nr:hypothetical protein HPB47_003974 [Ixodes persulcatus]